jgi:hypothetical protein
LSSVSIVSLDIPRRRGMLLFYVGEYSVCCQWCYPLEIFHIPAIWEVVYLVLLDFTGYICTRPKAEFLDAKQIRIPTPPYGADIDDVVGGGLEDLVESCLLVITLHTALTDQGALPQSGQVVSLNHVPIELPCYERKAAYSTSR